MPFSTFFLFFSSVKRYAARRAVVSGRPFLSDSHRLVILAGVLLRNAKVANADKQRYNTQGNRAKGSGTVSA